MLNYVDVGVWMTLRASYGEVKVGSQENGAIGMARLAWLVSQGSLAGRAKNHHWLLWRDGAGDDPPSHKDLDWTCGQSSLIRDPKQGICFNFSMNMSRKLGVALFKELLPPPSGFRKVLPGALAMIAAAEGAGTLIGDLRLSSGTYSGGYTYFDAASGGDLTRNVPGAPVNVNSNFIAVTQNADGASPESATDIGLQTFSSSTVIRQLNRFAADQDGPGAGGGPQRAGAVQWTVDLSPLGGYLSTNDLDLTALDLRLRTDPSDDAKEYDVYLSYTNVSETISLAGLSTSATTAGDDNYDNFWFPAQSVAEGGIANGTHKVIERDFTGDMDITVDLLALYDAGVTELNVIMASGAFLSGRTIGVLEGSGLSIDTAPIPEPGVGLLVMVGSFGLLRRRR